MLAKIAQLLLFGVLPYLAVTVMPLDAAARDDEAVVMQEPADQTADVDEPTES